MCQALLSQISRVVAARVGVAAIAGRLLYLGQVDGGVTILLCLDGGCLTINSEPTATMAEFTASNIKDVNVQFIPGEDFDKLRSEAEFNLVSSRAVQVAAVKAEKNGDTTIDLTEIKKPSSNGGNSDSGGDNSGNLGE